MTQTLPEHLVLSHIWVGSGHEKSHSSRTLYTYNQILTKSIGYITGIVDSVVALDAVGPAVVGPKKKKLIQ